MLVHKPSETPAKPTACPVITRVPTRRFTGLSTGPRHFNQPVGRAAHDE